MKNELDSGETVTVVLVQFTDYKTISCRRMKKEPPNQRILVTGYHFIVDKEWKTIDGRRQSKAGSRCLTSLKCGSGPGRGGPYEISNY